MTDRLEFTVVAAAPDGVSGSILASVLESAGIPVEVRGRGSSWLFPAAAGGLGMVQVLVPREYVAEARELLAARLDDVPEEKRPVEVATEGGGLLAAALNNAGIPAAAARSPHRGGSVLVPLDRAEEAREFIAELLRQADDDAAGGSVDEAENEDDEYEDPDVDANEDVDEDADDADVDEDEELVDEAEPPEDDLDDVGLEESGRGPAGDEPGADLPVPQGDDEPRDTDAAGLEPADAAGLEPDPGGPPAYGSDLRPDFGDGCGPDASDAGR